MSCVSYRIYSRISLRFFPQNVDHEVGFASMWIKARLGRLIPLQKENFNAENRSDYRIICETCKESCQCKKSSELQES